MQTTETSWPKRLSFFLNEREHLRGHLSCLLANWYCNIYRNKHQFVKFSLLRCELCVGVFYLHILHGTNKLFCVSSISKQGLYGIQVLIRLCLQSPFINLISSPDSGDVGNTNTAHFPLPVLVHHSISQQFPTSPSEFLSSLHFLPFPFCVSYLKSFYINCGFCLVM